MRTFSSLLATLTLALAVTAKPTAVVIEPQDSIISLAIHKNTGTDASSVRRSATNRVRQLQGRAVDLEGTDNQFFYSVDVKIGEPPLVYGLAVDTASGNTWVGAGRAFVNSQTTIETNSTLSLTLTRAWPAESLVQIEGYEVLDRLAITPDLVIEQQSIGVVTDISAEWMPRGDGPFGIGPTSSSLGTLLPDAETPTILDNLAAQGAVTNKVVGVSFNVSQSSASFINGELTLGGIDSSKYVGDLTYVPVTSAAPSSKYWGIDSAVRYGNGTELLSTTAGIIDSASVLNFLSTDALQQYVNATGAVWDDYSGLYTLTPAQYAKVQSLYVEVGGTTFELTANSQIWPRSQERGLFGTTNKVYLLMGDLGTPSGQGLDFVLGMPALERLYTVFDSDNKRVGLAATPYSFVEVK